jgi:hypothetical protein
VSSSRERKHLLLAASYPAREYEVRSDSQEIAAAVKAVIAAAFYRGWHIVFGGHPTISPLILMIAREYGREESVTIYQSAYFRNHLATSTVHLAEQRFGHIELVESDPREPIPGRDEEVNPVKCPLSLLSMRRAMISHPGIGGLVLIGGDSGILHEFELFRKMRPDLPAMPVGVPGGASRELVDSAHTPGMDPELRSALSTSRNYLFLFSRVMGYLKIERR